MQIEYDGSHSITFYDYRAVTTGNDASITSHKYNTWTDWCLIPTSAPVINPFEAKISIVSVGGSNRVVDLSEALTGSVLVGRNTGDWEFIMDIERAIKDPTIVNVSNPWDLYFKINSAIHGKWVAVVLDDMLNRTYTGRISVSDFNIDSQYAKIKFTYNLGYRGRSKIGDRKAE